MSILISEYTNDELRRMPDACVLFHIERQAPLHLWDAPTCSISRDPVAIYTVPEQAAIVARARHDVADRHPSEHISFQTVPCCYVTDEEFTRLRAYLKQEFTIKMSLHMLSKKVYP